VSPVVSGAHHRGPRGYIVVNVMKVVYSTLE